ncbi:MAG: hypothetical protein HZA93_05415 [Verrucomicrobia bacterium]|nr:hypothetical protein [Verrucomicrobiota bacterium]
MPAQLCLAPASRRVLLAGMGFFDRFSAKKPAPGAASDNTPATPAPAGAQSGALARLAAARETLDAKDLPGALAIYEEVLATAGERADVLVTVSGDLGSRGHVAEIVELIAPRYDAERHGPATGLNLLQAYLAVRNADAAQHVLDILFALERPELEDRLHGFSNAIAELLNDHTAPGPGAPPPGVEVPRVGLITISKPVWFYGLEPMAAQLLPPKDGRLRRIAFAQLALPGVADVTAAMKLPEDELGRLSRALPLWLCEALYFSPSYAPITAIGLFHPPGAPALPMLFGGEWTLENLRQLVDTTEGGLDYIVTGALRATDGDYQVTLRVWEVKSYRERKTFTARWTPATADAALTQLYTELRTYMEWSPASAALVYAPPARPRAWLDTLGASLGLFVVEKGILSLDSFAPPADSLAQAAPHAASGEIASLAWLTLRARAAKHGVAAPAAVTLARSPLVNEAQKLLA